MQADDTELVRQLKARDKSAMAELLRVHGADAPMGALALLSSAVRNNRHRNGCRRDARNCRCTLAHGQRIAFDLDHHLGPNFTRTDS